MLNLKNNVRLLIPSARLNASPELRTAVQLAVMDIGGVTITEARGQWINPADGEMMTDHLLIHSFYYEDKQTQDVCLHVYRICDRLLELGEASVAFEQSSSHGLVMSIVDDQHALANLMADLEVENATLH